MTESDAEQAEQQRRDEALQRFDEVVGRIHSLLGELVEEGRRRIETRSASDPA